MDLTTAILTDHATEQLAARGIEAAQVQWVLQNPDQILPVRDNRMVAQRVQIDQCSNKPILLRVFVDIDRTPPEVVTAYRTSKIDKYQSQP